jgi:hypothetical protein
MPSATGVGVRRGAWSVERYLPPFGFTGHRSLPTIPSPHALSTTSVNRQGPPSMPRAELGVNGLKSLGRDW